MDELLADFLNEARDSLLEMDASLLQLERTPNDRTILQSIFRGMHTIKGTCGFLGLGRLEKLAHAVETLLVTMRDGGQPAQPASITRMLQAADIIRDIIAVLAETGREPPGSDADLITVLNRLADGDDVPLIPQATPTVAAPQPVAEPAAGAAQTIRVNVDLLENLMTMVSELVLTRNQVVQLARTQEDHALNAPLQRLSHLTSELQENVMKTRMQPVGNAWNKLPRLVRNLCADLGKRVELVMRGEETELDRHVLELIRDPLTHMVRNSMDHGLETPSERRAVGKPECGRIMLEASHEGGHIVIRMSDDGRGLNTRAIAEKALAQRLVTEQELASMTDAQISHFIFAPGFSTAASVTAVSGRGVGMDVVRANIEQIGGSIELHSAANEGTCFTLRIPLTLAIVSALIVEAGQIRFAVPQINVEELVHARMQAGDFVPRFGLAIEQIDTTPVLRLRDALLPLVDLNALLCLDSPPDAGRTVVVVSGAAARFGIIVDRVLDTEEIVVKPMADSLRHIQVYGGNTILGDGSVIMILDPNGIARSAGIRAVAVECVAAQADALAETMAMLLFRAGGRTLKAVPLSLVARIESVPRGRIEMVGGQPIIQYRDALMRLVPYTGIGQDSAEQPLLVFAEGKRSMGLMVDEIVDVVELPVRVDPLAAGPGLLGSAIIAGQAVEIIDTHYWITRAGADWFRAPERGERAGRDVLLVEDSSFFRQILMPALTAAGYRVTMAENGNVALRLRDSGLQPDAIISDIEMPGMDGLELVRTLRARAEPWSNLPMIALTGHDMATMAAPAEQAGFDECVHKFELDKLLQVLQRRMALRAQA